MKKILSSFLVACLVLSSAAHAANCHCECPDPGPSDPPITMGSQITAYHALASPVQPCPLTDLCCCCYRNSILLQHIPGSVISDRCCDFVVFSGSQLRVVNVVARIRPVLSSTDRFNLKDGNGNWIIDPITIHLYSYYECLPNGSSVWEPCPNSDDNYQDIVVQQPRCGGCAF